MALNGVKYFLLACVALLLTKVIVSSQEQRTVIEGLQTLSTATTPKASIAIDDTFSRQSIRALSNTKIAPKNASYQTIQNGREAWPLAIPFDAVDQQNRSWFNIDIQHQGHLPLDLTIVVGNKSLDEVDAYILDHKGRIMRAFHVGATRHQYSEYNYFQNYSFPFTLRPGQTVTVMIAVADAGLHQYPIALWNEEAWASHEFIYVLLSGALAGSLLMMFGYSLITYMIKRTKVRFWFALLNISLLGVVLSSEGFLEPSLGISPLLSSITITTLALAFFTAAKMTKALTNAPHTILCAISFGAPIGLLAGSFFIPTYWLNILVIILCPLLMLLQLIQVHVFVDGNNRTASRLMIIGWLVIVLAMLLKVQDFALAHAPSNIENSLSVLLMLVGILCQAMAIEAKEKKLHSRLLSDQQAAIHDLSQFYDLFKNSAEGLYTSTLSGNLISVNPAMCALFGYENEESMLSSVSNTSEFYVKPIDRDKLVGEILEKGVVMGREIKGVKADGTEFWFSISCQLRQEENSSFMYGSIFDVTEKKMSDMSLEYMATHDPLTGVFNRREFERLLAENLSKAHENENLALLYLDLDRFKIVNDSCGHKAGDALIKELSQLLDGIASKYGAMARLGGDEFAVLLANHNEDSAYLLAMRLLNAVQEYRFIWDNRIFTLGVSIGLVDCTERNSSSEQYISMADAACYVAKDQGRNKVHRYRPDDESLQKYEQEINWVSKITDALRNDTFELYYQHYRPLNRANEGHHYEILLRLKDGDRIIPPNAFLPSAERYDLSAKIDHWVVEKSFEWLSQHQVHLSELSRCNINLSGQSLADQDLKLYILNAFEKYAIPYHKVCFEITETTAIVKMDETLQFMRTFKQLGCKFALDDFGSGFSSYANLKNLPVDCVKIDGSFVREILTNSVDLVMVSSIKDIAQAMGMETVGEFVENDAIMTQLGKMGVDYAQGYGVAKPQPLKSFTALNN